MRIELESRLTLAFEDADEIARFRAVLAAAARYSASLIGQNPPPVIEGVPLSRVFGMIDAIDQTLLQSSAWKWQPGVVSIEAPKP